MGDFLFVLKTLVITIVLVLLMQIKIGTATIEQHSLAWIQNSAITDTLRSVAQGAVKATVQGYRWMSSAFDTNVGKRFSKENEPGSRLSIKLHRSEAYEREQDKKARARAEREAQQDDGAPETANGDAID